MIEQVAAYRDLAADGAAKQGEWHEHDGASFIETDDESTRPQFYSASLQRTVSSWTCC